MNNKNNAPDFLVQWQDDSLQSSLEINCEPTIPESASPLKAKLRQGAILHEAKHAVIAVNELRFTQPTVLNFMPNRMGFSLLVASTAAVRYGYGGEEPRALGSSALMMMLPGREIIATISAGVMRTVTCTFSVGYAESIMGSLAAISQVRLLDALDVRSTLVSSIMFRLMNEAIYPSPISDKVVDALGQALLVECAHWSYVEKQPASQPRRLSAQDFELIEQCLSGADGKAPSVTELASLCGFSERYFSKLFREQTGCSISQYIKSVKIARAKAYLLETDLSLKEIAYRLGYSTPASFSYAFRCATGRTPAAFRFSE